jgi:hypothetical protein
MTLDPEQFYAVSAAVTSGLAQIDGTPYVTQPKEIFRARLQHLLSDPAIFGNWGWRPQEARGVTENPGRLA